MSCTNCEVDDAVVVCDECSQSLCKDCDAQFHKTEKKKNHVRKPVGATTSAVSTTTLCENCEDEQAVLHCKECDLDMCNACEQDFHKSSKLASHTRTPIAVAEATPAPEPQVEASPSEAAGHAGTLCDNCTENAAIESCKECDMDVCEDCSAGLHKSAKTKLHHRTPLAAADPPAKTEDPPAASQPTEGALCENCEERPGVENCTECDMVLCEECSIGLHKSSKMKNHARTPLKSNSAAAVVAAGHDSKMMEGGICGNCEENNAVEYCEECDMKVCEDCTDGMHKSAKTKLHTRHPVKPPLEKPPSIVRKPTVSLAADPEPPMEEAPSKRNPPAKLVLENTPVKQPPAAKEVKTPIHEKNIAKEEPVNELH